MTSAMTLTLRSRDVTLDPHPEEGRHARARRPVSKGEPHCVLRDAHRRTADALLSMRTKRIGEAA